MSELRLQSNADDSNLEPRHKKIFREEKKSYEKKEPKHHHNLSKLLDKEININLKINPKNAFKFTCIMAVLLFVFFLGRWTAPEASPEASSFGFSEIITSVTGLFHSEKLPAEEATKAEVEEEATLAGTEETPSENETSAEEEPPAEEAAAEETEEETQEEETEEENTPEENDEPIITTYKAVSFEIKKAHIDWKGSWGKITKLDYTLTNNEAGTIKPSHFTMNVEGYGDFTKEIPLNPGAQIIKSKKAVSSTVVVPQGFNYMEKTAGDLTNVELTLMLIDDNGRPMASFKKAFDLSG